MREPFDNLLKAGEDPTLDMEAPPSMEAAPFGDDATPIDPLLADEGKGIAAAAAAGDFSL